MSTELLVTMGMVASRLGGVMMLIPAFGARGVPKMVKVICVIAMTLVIGPTLPPVDVSPTFAHLLVGVMTEVIVGVLMGGVVSFIFGSLSLANEVMSNQIGHGAAQLFDPMLKVSHGPLATLGTFLAALIFLGTNLHLVLFINVADSFHAVPPGGVASPIGGGVVWIEIAREVLEAGIGLAGPVLVLIFLIHVFVAVLTRLAPNMNIFFSLGMVMTMLAGCWMLMVMLPYQFEMHHQMVSTAVERAPDVLRFMDLVQ